MAVLPFSGRRKKSEATLGRCRRALVPAWAGAHEAALVLLCARAPGCQCLPVGEHASRQAAGWFVARPVRQFTRPVRTASQRVVRQPWLRGARRCEQAPATRRGARPKPSGGARSGAQLRVRRSSRRSAQGFDDQHRARGAVDHGFCGSGGARASNGARAVETGYRVHPGHDSTLRGLCRVLRRSSLLGRRVRVQSLRLRPCRAWHAERSVAAPRDQLPALAPTALVLTRWAATPAI